MHTYYVASIATKILGMYAHIMHFKLQNHHQLRYVQIKFVHT